MALLPTRGLGTGAAGGGGLFGGLIGGRPNPLMYAGLGLLSQGPSLTPQSPFAGLATGLGMYSQARNAYENRELQRERLELRKQAAAREEAEAEARAQARDRAAQILGVPGQEMVGPIMPGEERPIVGGSGLAGGDLSLQQAGAQLAALPGYEGVGAGLIGQAAASERAEATREHQAAVLEETTRHHQAVEQNNAARLAATAAAAEREIAEQGQLSEEGIRATRSQFESATRKDRDSLKAYESVRNLAAAQNPSIAGDTALIFQFMKTLDPMSTVREGEVATVENSAGIPARVRNMYNRAMGGEALNAQQRREIEEAARTAVTPRIKALRQTTGRYRDIAMRGGANPADIITYEVPENLLEPPEFPGEPKSILSDDEYNALPSGAMFRAPDGTVRRKP